MLNKNKRAGMTVMEVLIAIGLMVIIVMFLYRAFFGIIRSLGEAKIKVGAVALANEKMEIIRNLSYENIGIIQEGLPGVIPSEEIIKKNGFKYQTKTQVRYIDDAVDGLYPLDEWRHDYKQVQIEVSWISGSREKSAIFSSNFSE